MVQTRCGRGSRAPRRRRLAVGLLGLVVLVVTGAACSSSGAADASALPRPDAPSIGLALDANVMSPSDLSTFDDTNGHGAVPAGGPRPWLRRLLRAHDAAASRALVLQCSA